MLIEVEMNINKTKNNHLNSFQHLYTGHITNIIIIIRYAILHLKYYNFMFIRRLPYE